MDNKTIRTKANELTVPEIMKLINDKVLADLTELYGDIRVELYKTASDNESMIDAYSESLANEQKILSPELVYQAGCEAVQTGQEYAPADYFKKVYSSYDVQALLTERDNMFHTLCNLLGDTRGLVREYTELYRQFYGILNSKIDMFYHWGYYGEMPDTEKNVG